MIRRRRGELCVPQPRTSHGDREGNLAGEGEERRRCCVGSKTVVALTLLLALWLPIWPPLGSEIQTVKSADGSLDIIVAELQDVQEVLWE